MPTIDTGTPDLLASLDEGVLTLTMNRPEARNAMSQAMNLALQQQLASAELDPAVKCIVLTGAGKGFCAGGDVKGMAARGDGTVGAQTIDEATRGRDVSKSRTVADLLPDVLEVAEHGQSAVLGTGWPDLDRTLGGLAPGRLVSVRSAVVSGTYRIETGKN